MRGNLSEGWTAWDGCASEIGRCVIAQKGVTGFLEGLCSREGKVEDIFVLVINISRWNQMDIGNVPWNNEAITIH